MQVHTNIINLCWVVWLILFYLTFFIRFGNGYAFSWLWHILIGATLRTTKIIPKDASDLNVFTNGKLSVSILCIKIYATNHILKMLQMVARNSLPNVLPPKISDKAFIILLPRFNSYLFYPYVSTNYYKAKSNYLPPMM